MTDMDRIRYGRELIENESCIIERIVRYSASNTCKIDMTADMPLTPRDNDCISAYVCSELGVRAVDLHFRYSDAPYRMFDADIDAGIDLLKRTWGQIAPEIAPIIQLSVFKYRGLFGNESRYDMLLPLVFMRVITQQYIAELRAAAEKLWGWSVRITVAENTDAPTGVMSSRDVMRDSGRAPERVRSAKPVEKNKPRSASPSISAKDVVFGREIRRPNITKMSDIDDRTGNVTVLGMIIDIEATDTRDKTHTIIRLTVSDKTNTITIKLFPDQNIAPRTIKSLNDIKAAGDMAIVRGNYRYDNYLRDYVLFANDINRKDAPKRTDDSHEGKRVELHLHTQMSAMDGLTRVSEVVATAARWGHRAIAITDHGVVHALPEAMKAAKANKIKVIFGCEGYLLDDSELRPMPDRYIAVAATFSGSGAKCAVFEIGAVALDSNGNETARFHTFAAPSAAIPKRISELCRITNDIIADAPNPAEAINAFIRFADGAALVAYDAETVSALRSLNDSRIPSRYVDVGLLNKDMSLAIENYSMMEGAVAHYDLEGSVLPAAEAADKLAERFKDLLRRLAVGGISQLPFWDCTNTDDAKLPLYHITLLAANKAGLKNLYKLVSYAHLEFYRKRPRIPRSLLNLHREGLIVGSACERGEVFRSIIHKLPFEEQLRIAKGYDYLEIQPLANNAFMLRNGMAADENELRAFNLRVMELGDALGKPVVATGDVHFLNPDDAVYRSILMHAHGFTDAEQQAPLYFRTTDDMLKEFAYLGHDRAVEVVVTNTNAIADQCEQLHPFLDEKSTYSPELPGATEQLEEMALGEAHRRYGETLPEIVQKRLDKELKSIIGNGYSSLYMVAQKLVSKSLSDGYLVGSRGSVGSSFVATMLGITEVNALPPHYLCPQCQYSEFVLDARSRCGIDLPDKDCPKCGARLGKEGYDIPFEVFLGFKGDKTPDIDLNFSGEYQPVAHHFTEEMFGEGHAFRAGTISAVQDKTVYGYVKHFCEDMEMHVSEAEVNRLVSGCLGVKKTTGQHPGGIIIVPEDYEIFDFCPVQHPADKMDSGSVTTHFDFHALDDRLVKLDILGHDDPTALRMLHDITGIDPRTIPLDDPETMAIYRTDETLGVKLEPLGCDVGSLGIPEFGTNFVRGMLRDTRPTTMEELVRIAGLSHGTDVWTNNAQLLVENGTATLMDVICTRDDIMNYLISMGGEPSLSFKTMESVRKGRGLTEEMQNAMKAISVPQWFIDSCKKIQYMFPRAHAAAYVMMSFRVAYYKVHHPLAFYAVYFTVRADTFDIELCSGGLNAVMENLERLKRKERLDPKEKDAVVILEVVAEMNMRGFELLPVDLYKSKAKTFTIEEGKLRPPFTSIAGLGESVAVTIENAAAGGSYISKEDFINRTKANSAVMEKLERLGCFKGMSDTNQISMF